MTKIVFKFSMFTFALCLSVFALSYADTLDKVIVVVNGETITQGELDAASAAQESEEAKKEILNRMIEEKLVLSEAKKRNVEVADLEIEEKLKEIKLKFESDEDFNEALKEGGISLNELKQKYADQIKVAKLVEMEVRKKIVITPSEILEYYNLHKEEFKDPQQAKVKNILIKPDKDLPDEDARILAEKILGFLKAGENFDELALKYSKGPNADRGGELGFVKRGQMLKEIEDVVFNLNVGQLSEVIKTQLGYHIFKVEEKKQERIKELNEVKDEIEKALFFTKGKQRYKEWIEDLKKNAFISFR